MIPGYRIRFYCLLGVLLCGAGMVAFVSDVLEALLYQGFNAMTGWRRHRVWEHLTLSANPIRFWIYLAWSAFGAAASTYGVYKLSRGVLLGKRAYKRWQDPEWIN